MKFKGGLIVMNRRYFWLIPEFTRFRAVFEDAETVTGVNDERQHRLFRKDTGRVCFDEREALQRCLTALIEQETEDVLTRSAEVVGV
jgi:hypothetical protein